MTPDGRKVAFVTGANGQDGSYLLEFLLDKGYVVHGLIRRASQFNTQRIRHLYKEPWEEDCRLFLPHGDVNDAHRMRELIGKILPDEVYHLAAQSHVMVSFEGPIYSVNTCAMGTLNMLEACRDSGLPIRFYNAASSEMFGSSPPPQNENTPFKPRSPYGCAKVYGFHQTVNFREAYGMFACNGILMNHESPRRMETFVTRKITRAATRIKVGLQQELRLGNLDSRRDWGFAGDYVEAMWLMLQQEKPDDYVISTGISYTVREFVDEVFNRLYLDSPKYLVHDLRLVRPAEVDYLCGDSAKAEMILGWRPKTSFSQLVDLMVNHDLKLATREALHGHE